VGNVELLLRNESLPVYATCSFFCVASMRGERSCNVGGRVGVRHMMKR